MKKSIIISFLVICTITSYSQDNLPSPFIFNYRANDTLRVNETLKKEYFPQTKFMLGTQWYGHPRMLKALEMNENQGTWPDDTWRVIKNPYPDYKMYHIWEIKSPDYGQAFEFKPTLYIPIDKRGELIKSDLDPSRNIFGFSHRQGKIVLPIDDNNVRLGLSPLDLPNYSPDSIVLKNAWINNKYVLALPLDHKEFDANKHGVNWLLSINLRRLKLNESADPNDTILTIKLPYRERIDSITFVDGYVRFFEIPSDDRANYTALNYREDRGIALNRVLAGSDIREIAITYSMLPDLDFFNNVGKKDITINAFFICNGDKDLYNPYIQTSDVTLGIDTMDIEVMYHGKIGVGINYIRISTPDAYNFLIGYKDLNYQSRIQNMINEIDTTNYEIYGMYGQDEFNIEHFTAQRYNSALLNSCVVSEGAGFHFHDYYVNHSNYYIDPLAVWAPSGHFRESTRAPFYPTPESSDPLITKYRLGYGYGYRESNSVDTLNSHYETRLDGGLWWLWFRDSSSAYTMGKYFSRTANESATQMRIEHSTYYRFHQQPNYLYGDKFWWANNFPVGNWGVNDNYAHLGNARPHTGEEVRWMLWSSILMGAKGLFYDARCDSLQDKSSNTTGGFLNNIPQKNKYDTMPLDSLIFSDDPAFGVDFIPEIDSAMYIHNYIDLDSTAKYLGVPKNRIYYGRKSPKIEMYNLHKWIRANDSLLMNLRLVSAFSKGYRIWRSTDTSRFVDTIMNNYVKLDDRMIIHDSEPGKTLASDFGITTRPINRELNNEPYYEPYDSSFFDIALHRFQDDEDLSSGNFVLSVLNRRTDPLVYFTEDTSDKHLLFLTPSEFDRLCDSGGVNPMRPDGASYPDTLWQSYYWKRLGAREITVPIASPTGVYQNGVYSVQARELGVDHYDELMFTYSEPYYHRIDTTVPVGGAIVSKHLPGQGKMIECKINSVFSETNSDCPVCETINDFEHFNVILESKGKIYDHCCYDIKIQNLASCTGGIVPIKLISNTTREIFIDNMAFVDEDGNKVANSQFNLQNSGDFLLGELCVMESPEPITFEIVVGSTVDWIFYGCDRKFKFVLNCESDTTDANNCCDLFDVVSTYVPPGNPPQSCSTILEINNTGDNNCISSILFDQFSNGNYVEIDSSTVEPIFASAGIHLLKTINIPLALCLPGSTPMFSKDATMIFRGSDGEIICTKEVPIYYCCEVMQDPGPIDPNYRLSNDKIDNLAINNEVQLEIVPNPNFGYAKLGIESKYATIGTIKILSLTGEIVKEFPHIPVKASRDEISLNLSDVSTGSYYLIFESEYGISSINIIKL